MADNIKILNISHGNLQRLPCYFYMLFSVNDSTLVIESDVYYRYYEDEDGEGHYDKSGLSIEIMSIKPVEISSSAKQFKTNNNDLDDKNPYVIGVRLGNATIKTILRIIIEEIKSKFPNQIIKSITGERITGANARNSMKQRNKTIFLKNPV